MQDGCNVYMDSYMASYGSCFMVTWIIFQNHFLGHSFMYRFWSFFFVEKISGPVKKGWCHVPGHPSHPRTGTPHGYWFHILCCVKMGAKEPAVQWLQKDMCRLESSEPPVIGSAGHLGYEI